MPNNKRIDKILRLMGLAVKAGRVTIGSNMTCDALKKKRLGQTPVLVLLAYNAAANTRKRMENRAAYYKIPLVTLKVKCEELAVAVGKPEAVVAAVGICEPQLAGAIQAEAKLAAELKKREEEKKLAEAEAAALAEAAASAAQAEETPAEEAPEGVQVAEEAIEETPADTEETSVKETEALAEKATEKTDEAKEN